MLTRKAKNQLDNIEARQSKYKEYLEAKVTANRVLEAKEKRDVTLVAPVQSGKTAVMVELIKMDMLKNLPTGKETLYLYTCLLPRNTITKQTEERFIEALGKDDGTLEPTYVRVLMPSELSKITHRGSTIDVSNYDEVFLILDEVHTHSREKGIGESVRKLRNKGVSLTIIYVTATPGVHGIVKNTNIVMAVVPLGYRGVKDLNIRELPSGAFCGNNSVMEPEVEIEQDILKLKSDESIVVRATGNRIEELAWVNRLYSHLVDVYRVESEDDWFNLDKLMNGTQKQNGKGNLFILKQGLTAGNTITNKRHIVAVYETSNANDAGVIQGLVGRMCGYDEINPGLTVYCNTVSVEKYLGFYDGRIDAMSTPGNKETVSTGRYKVTKPRMFQILEIGSSKDVVYTANIGDNVASREGMKLFNERIKRGSEKINTKGIYFFTQTLFYKVSQKAEKSRLVVREEDRVLSVVMEFERNLQNEGVKFPLIGGYEVYSPGYSDIDEEYYTYKDSVKKGTYIPINKDCVI